MIDKIFTEGGNHFAIGQGIAVTVLDRPVEEGKALPNDTALFRRNGIKMNMGNGDQQRVQWLVGRLDGVAVYMIRDAAGTLNVVLSREDLYP